MARQKRAAPGGASLARLPGLASAISSRQEKSVREVVWLNNTLRPQKCADKSTLGCGNARYVIDLSWMLFGKQRADVRQQTSPTHIRAFSSSQDVDLKSESRPSSDRPSVTQGSGDGNGQSGDKSAAATKTTNLRNPRSAQAVHLKPLKRSAEYGIPSCDLQLRSYSI